MAAFFLVASLLPVDGLSPATPALAQPTEPTLEAELIPPNTNFEVTIPGRDVGDLEYRWSAALSCGTFIKNFPQPNMAQWNHPEGEPPEACPHEGTFHEGLITVKVSDSSGLIAICRHSNSLSGTNTCEIPAKKIEIVSPQPDSVVNNGTIITTELAPGLLDNVTKTRFTFTPQGGSPIVITAPAPDFLGFPAALWDTTNLLGGSYILTAKLFFDVNGVQQVANDQVTVRVNEPPIAFATADEVSRAGSFANVRFDAVGSIDNDGEIVSYKWDFGDGTTGEGRLTEHTYSPGTYQVTLVVTDNEGATSTGHLTLEVRADAASGISLVRNEACGCRSMEIKATGTVEGPEEYGYSPLVAPFPESEQDNLGPYNDGETEQLDMTKSEFVIGCRFQVIAELYEGSAPHLCAEGQMVKRTAHYGGSDEPKRGGISSDPRYDSTFPDDPYNSDDNTKGVEVANCPFRGRRWCDDDYHGGGAGDGTGTEGLQPPNPLKLHEGQSRVLWLDGPGFSNLEKKYLRPDGVTYLAKFKAKVGGSLGSCECSWTVRIRISAAGRILENQLTNVTCTNSAAS